jgi:hypothetical protein
MNIFIDDSPYEKLIRDSPYEKLQGGVRVTTLTFTAIPCVPLSFTLPRVLSGKCVGARAQGLSIQVGVG